MRRLGDAHPVVSRVHLLSNTASSWFDVSQCGDVLSSTPPLPLRSEGSKTRGQDDITHKLQDIVKRCAEVADALKQKHWRRVTLTPDAMERISRLQYEVYTLFNHTVRGQKPLLSRSGCPMKSYVGRLKGKEGRSACTPKTLSCLPLPTNPLLRAT